MGRAPAKQAQPKEVGIDVWLALEAYDLAVHKKFDVLALVACDGDYVPLVRKLNSIGTRVVLLAWDFKTERSETRTSQLLINECSYPIMMHEEIDNRARQRDPIIDGLFVADAVTPPRPAATTTSQTTAVITRRRL